jgi:hypothetical protein
MTCLCGCNTKAMFRGLCSATYQRYCKAVQRRELSWKQLIREGRALTKKKSYGRWMNGANQRA